MRAAEPVPVHCARCWNAQGCPHTLQSTNQLFWRPPVPCRVRGNSISHCPAGQECRRSHRSALLVSCGLESLLYQVWLLRRGGHSGKAHSSTHTYRLGLQALALGDSVAKLFLRTELQWQSVPRARRAAEGHRSAGQGHGQDLTAHENNRLAEKLNALEASDSFQTVPCPCPCFHLLPVHLGSGWAGLAAVSH